jgi:hypothetical protein
MGLSRRAVVGRLSELLGTRAESPPRSECSGAYTEVAWRHLYVELRHGRLAGFRYLETGWPSTDSGEGSAVGDLPLLVTSHKITLGSTLRQARAAYGRLALVGTDRWQTPDGLVLYADRPGSRITAITYGTCGT